MSHEIKDKMFYSLMKPAWHGITEPSLVPCTAIEILNNDNFKGAFAIELRPATVTLNGIPQETGDFAIVRATSKADPKEVVFAYCTERYLPLQPKEICEAFDSHVCEPVETLFFLREGQQMVITWKMPSFEVVVGDQVDLYGTISTGFDTLIGANLLTSSVRSVCMNTFVAAQNWANNNTDGKGKGNIWKGKAVNKNLLRDLGYWMEHVQTNALVEADLLKSFFGKLSNTPIRDDAQAKGLLVQAFPNKQDVSEYYPSQLKDAKKEKIEVFNGSQGEIRNGIFDLFSGAGTKITPDYWGLFNAGTEFMNHYLPSKKPVYASIMFGSRQKYMQDLALVLAKNT